MHFPDQLGVSKLWSAKGKKIYGKSVGGVTGSTLAKYASVPKRHMINGSGQVAPHQQVFMTSLFPSFYYCVHSKNVLANLNHQNLRGACRKTTWLMPFITSLYMTLATGTVLPINTQAHTHTFSPLLVAAFKVTSNWILPTSAV